MYFKCIPLRLVKKYLLVLMCLDSKSFTKRMVKQRERDEGNDATNGKFDPFAQTHKRLHVRKRAQNEPSRPENVRVSHLDKIVFCTNFFHLILTYFKENDSDESNSYSLRWVLEKFLFDDRNE